LSGAAATPTPARAPGKKGRGKKGERLHDGEAIVVVVVAAVVTVTSRTLVVGGVVPVAGATDEISLVAGDVGAV